jgi:hypothetical protein
MDTLRRRWLGGRSVRLRLTTLYAALFLLSGAGLLAITDLVAGLDLRNSAPAQPGVHRWRCGFSLACLVV